MYHLLPVGTVTATVIGSRNDPRKLMLRIVFCDVERTGVGVMGQESTVVFGEATTTYQCGSMEASS